MTTQNLLRTLLLSVLACTIFQALPAAAATFVVTNANDTGPGSLRAAVTQANSNGQPDTITFDPQFFSTPRTITLTSQIRISDNFNTVEDLTITGPGAGLLTISGNNATRIFRPSWGIRSRSAE